MTDETGAIMAVWGGCGAGGGNGGGGGGGGGGRGGTGDLRRGRAEWWGMKGWTV